MAAILDSQWIYVYEISKLKKKVSKKKFWFQKEHKFTYFVLDLKNNHELGRRNGGHIGFFVQIYFYQKNDIRNGFAVSKNTWKDV